VDVVFGGELFAVVDSASVWIPCESGYASALIDAAERLRSAVDDAIRVLQPTIEPVYGVIVTGTPRMEGDARSAVVVRGGILHRSPNVAATVAVLARRDSLRRLDEQYLFVHESMYGERLCGKVLVRRQLVSGTPFIMPLTASALGTTCCRNQGSAD
jgi:proline racemase